MCIRDRDSGSHVVIIGGSEHHIQKYRAKAQQLGLSDRIHLIGPRPLKELDNYILQADILTSPRIKGNNTPMKIYSYLHSGKPILATNLPTHSQVMDRRVAEMSHVEPQAFADGLLRLLEDEGYCKQLGAAAKALAEREYTFSVFAKKLNQIYDRVGQRIELTPQIAQ